MAVWPFPCVSQAEAHSLYIHVASENLKIKILLGGGGGRAWGE